jgi:hypothetical protein
MGNSGCIEEFIGIKENSIKQEYFASLTKSNIFMQFMEAANTIGRRQANLSFPHER